MMVIQLRLVNAPYLLLITNLEPNPIMMVNSLFCARITVPSIDNADPNKHINYCNIFCIEAYNAWRIGDTKLDWYFAQEGQGTHNGASAMGTPGVWTTNDASHDGYQELNTYVSQQIMIF